MITSNLDELMEGLASQLVKMSFHPSIIEPLEDEALFCCNGLIEAIQENHPTKDKVHIAFSLNMHNDIGEATLNEIWLHADIRSRAEIPNGHYLLSHVRSWLPLSRPQNATLIPTERLLTEGSDATL